MKRQGSMRTRKIVNNVVVHVILAILSIIWVLPIFFAVLTSLREEGGSTKSYIWPRGFTLNNYKNVLFQEGSLNFPRWFLNTLIVAIFSCLLASSDNVARITKTIIPMTAPRL